MADQKIWFPDPIQDSECKILTLSEPIPSNWEVVQKINEHVEQWQDAISYPSHPSLASTKFVCRDAQFPNGPTAFLRIVKQIPSAKGDIGPV
ncbi:hypothetical protein DTO006G1_2872 [Penicillium roqueforti]|uniref:uncharacterized protein n=1 Tax=Penicillium roqueforti TaxID=5082 RepID=UPI00190BD3DF|nr:uncharacterized protein LCP9604111_2121 [Penicillium roqueforti]KAF9252125.1 hypothetical protein LCP9604111_2121 [Penicillium roqueforti]KAI1837394.1 hypothetical protein CBS147337_1677 [Penicillium roqueforti]KAI2687832.1 hypothetical protein LCP963914a_3350 [Penicillium roqueforti]KAI2689795.1 hypothetical protein CBS147355_246 [Penicillium roqueforti]KAI2702337.1 hypothetical protein CBS147372_4070 [Penicillium roqueforti]